MNVVDPCGWLEYPADGPAVMMQSLVVNMTADIALAPPRCRWP